MCKWAGPIVDLLLDYVGPVQLCSKVSDLLDSREEWHSVKRKSCKCQTVSSTSYYANMSLPLPHTAYETYTRFNDFCNSKYSLLFPTASPRPLLHLCRLKVRTQIGKERMRFLTSLPLPERMIRYLTLANWFFLFFSFFFFSVYKKHYPEVWHGISESSLCLNIYL